MATRDSKPTTAKQSDEAMRRAGAKACMAALCKMIKGTNDMPDDAADFLGKQHNDASAVAASLGVIPPYVQGAVTAMAEFIHFAATTGQPDLTNGWLPWAAMSAGERADDVAQMRLDMGEDIKAVASCIGASAQFS